MPLYKVKGGKHNLGPDPENPGLALYAYAGEEIEMEEAEAAKFPGKFEVVQAPVEVAPPARREVPTKPVTKPK